MTLLDVKVYHEYLLKFRNGVWGWKMGCVVVLIMYAWLILLFTRIFVNKIAGSSYMNVFLTQIIVGVEWPPG